MSWLIVYVLLWVVIVLFERQRRTQERFNEAIRTIERLQGVRRDADE